VEYTKSAEESLKHLMFTHFPGFKENSMCSFTRDKTQSAAGYKSREWSLAAKVIHPCGDK